MAELVPVPLTLLLRRAFLEYQREGKIFDLPKSKFFLGFPGLDLRVSFHGRRASTPLGPAAGPHGQLAQNIVLSWLGGARIIELKTVQILDELNALGDGKGVEVEGWLAHRQSVPCRAGSRNTSHVYR